MCEYAGRIVNPITGRQEAVAATGYAFEPNEENLSRWKGWLRFVKIDQGIIFWLLGFITLFLLSVNAYAVLVPKGLIPEGLDIAVVQAHIFGERWGAVGFKLFLAMAFLMLFSVMWTVIDALTRIISDILYTNSRVGPFKKRLSRLSGVSIGSFYYAVIIVVVIAGALLLPLRQPLPLLVVSAVLGGLAMAIYTPFLIYLNNARLPKPLRPGWITNVAMAAISAFFIFFAVKVIASYLA